MVERSVVRQSIIRLIRRSYAPAIEVGGARTNFRVPDISPQDSAAAASSFSINGHDTGGRIRITARFTDTETGSHRLSETYDPQLEDILDADVDDDRLLEPRE